MAQKIAFVGNCQVLGLKLLYDRFVAGHTGNQTTYVPSYREIDETGSAALVGVTSIVEQVQEFTPTAVLPDAVRSAERCLVPLVSGAFLWPFAGEGHPSNASHQFMDVGPYPAELGDTYLNRLISERNLAGGGKLLSRLVDDPVLPKSLVTSYRSHRFQPDALDRRFEIVMDRQRKRDEICGFSIAEEIDRFFRTERLFMTPHHPDVRISRALAVQCFGQIGAPQTCIDMLAADLRRSPLPQDELPIHPAVAAHFKLVYINSDTEYSFHGEGHYSWAEWFERYIRYSWEPGIFEASAIAESDPGRARDLVRRALERVPQSPLAHFTLARALFRLGDAAGAAGEVETAARLDPQDPGIWRLAALIAMHRGRTEETCRFAAQCVTVDPADVLNLDLWARAQEGLGDFAGAEVARRKAVVLFPFSAVWHTELGTLLMKQPGRLAEALEEYRRGVELDPQHAGAHFGASIVLGKLDRIEEAIAAVRQAIQLNQHVALYYSHLGHLLARTGEREATLAAFRRVLEVEPQNAGVHNVIGNMLLHSEQFEEALEHRRRAAEFEPHNIGFQIALSDTLSSRNRLTEAIAPLEKAVAIEPGNVDLKLQLARLYMRAELLDDAVATLRQIHELAPRKANACYELSCVLERMGDLAGAEAAIELALAVDPDAAASKEQKIKLQEIVHGSSMALVPARYLASSAEQIIPAITVTTPKCLVYTNFLDLNPEFGRHHLQDLYVERERHLPAVSLCRLDPSIRLAVPDGEDIIPIQGNRVVAEQVRPNWGQERLRTAIAACKREDEIEGPVVLIGRYGVRTWGHWLGELLPKIVAVEAHKPGHFRYVLPQRFDWDPAHRTALESLRYYGVDLDRLALVSESTFYQARELYAVTSVWYPGNMIHPAAAELMRRRAEKHGDDTKKAAKVALLRRKGRSRNLANQQEVEEFLTERGWIFADLEEMNFEEQVNVFRNAHSILSILGSGLTGLVYARRGVNVLTLAPSHWGDLFFFARMQERDAMLADIRGTSLATDPEKVPTASFRVEISEIEAGLLALEEPDQVPAMSREQHASPPRCSSRQVTKDLEGSPGGPGERNGPATMLKEAASTQREKETAPYIEMLGRFHATLRPRTYLEIGTLTGTSLEVSKCASIAVDPGFRLEKDVLNGKPSCLFFQMTSDAFFADYSPSVLFGKPVDIAFLNGMHYAEFLLRDFINVERHARKHSVVMLHDCIPGNVEMTTRTIQQGVAWTGDVWKVIMVLKKYRPDLRIQAFDSPPTGLIVCTNLDPASPVLSNNYFTILNDFATLDLARIGVKSYQEMIGMTGTEGTKTFEGLTRDYWL